MISKKMLMTDWPPDKIAWNWPYIPCYEWQEIEKNSKRIWPDYDELLNVIPVELNEGYVVCIATTESKKGETHRYSKELFITRFIREV